MQSAGNLMIFFSFCLLSLGAEPAASADGLHEAGYAALQKFLPVIQRKTPAHRLELGIKPEDDLNHLTLGEPFEPHFLTADSIAKFAAGDKIEDLLVPAGQYYFPVVSNGHAVCLIAVAKMADGSWVPATMGMPELAHAWSMVTDAWPAKKGFTPLLIIVPSRLQFFFTVPQASYPNLTELRINAPLPNAMALQDLGKADEVIKQLREK
jgi:hypothetical protein